MKTLRLLFCAAVALLTCNSYGIGRPFQTDIVVTITNVDYSFISPEIGILSGTYTYHFSYQLSKDGYIESIHWNVTDFNLHNQNGEKAIIVDSGHDSNGDLWAWYNEPNNMNGNPSNMVYSCDNGWLDDLMQVQRGDETIYPRTEGVAVEMSCRLLVKGKGFRVPFLSVLQINANGVTTVDVVKP